MLLDSGGELNDQYFVRLTETFGEPSKEEAKNIGGEAIWRPRPEWMDLDEIFAELDDEEHVPLSEVREYRKTVELIQDQDARRRRGFWVFIKQQDSDLENKVRKLAENLGAKQI